MKTIVISGGHLTPALATADELYKRGWKIVYVGRRHSLEGDAAISQEGAEVTKRGYTFFPLVTGRLQRHLTMYTLLSLLKIPLGFAQSVWCILRYKPRIVLSFGGYVAVPVVMTAWTLRKVIVTHEQTRKPGLANRFISHFAKVVCISWPETKKYFQQKKIKVTGNPLRRELFSVKAQYDMVLDKPLIFVTGGNLGAHVLNKTIEELLPDVLNDYCVIHQTGNAKEYGDFERLQKKRMQFSETIRNRYYVTDYVDSDHIGWVYKKATYVISRAGANTVTELIALQKPAILVPLPWSGEGEQEANAMYLGQSGAALVVDQSKLNRRTLLFSLEQLAANKTTMSKALKKLGEQMSLEGARHLADVVEYVA